jgi:hypothetical protein
MATELSTGELPAPYQPTGTQRFLTRSLETFFAHWLLFLVPFMLIGAFGVYSASGASDEYKSTGTLSVSYQSFLGQLTQLRTSDFSYETPSSRTSRQFNELMQTDGFARSVIDRASTDLPPVANLPLVNFRAMVSAVSSGDSLMQVVGVADNPVLANVLVRSAVASFSEWVTDTEISASDAAVSFYEDQLSAYQDNVAATDAELAAYLVAHPPPEDTSEPRDVSEQLEIERLNADLRRVQDLYYAAVDKRDAAQLATTQSSVDVQQRLRVVDQPSLPTVPEAGFRTVVIKSMIFIVLGALVSLGAVALMSVLDRSVHSVSDLERLGASPIAVVPRVKNMGVRRRQAKSVTPIALHSAELRSA